MASHLWTGHALPPAQSVHLSIFTAISYMVTWLMYLGRQGATWAQGHAAAVLAASQVGKNSFSGQRWPWCWQRVLTEAKRLWQRQAHNTHFLRAEMQARHEATTSSLSQESMLPTPPWHGLTGLNQMLSQWGRCRYNFAVDFEVSRCLTLCRPQPNISLGSQGSLTLHLPSDNKQLPPLQRDSSRRAGERGQNH